MTSTTVFGPGPPTGHASGPGSAARPSPSASPSPGPAARSHVGLERPVMASPSEAPARSAAATSSSCATSRPSTVADRVALDRLTQRRTIDSAARADG